MATTPNKNYALQTTGTNVGTWGTVLNNGVFSIVDNNLGGTLPISVAGNSNINLTASQASYLIHDLTGLLTGNINYIFPTLGGFYAINNNTTGAFSVTVQVVGGSGGIVVPQGTTATVYIDATVPAVESFIGTSSVYSAQSVGGTANAIAISSVIPANFTLNTNILVIFVPTNVNTGSATLTTPDGSTKTIQKVSPSGLINLTGEELIPGNPVICSYTGATWCALNTVYFGSPKIVSTAQSLSLGAIFNSYIATAALTLTISRSATTLPVFWYIQGNALGGTITITPDSNDSINVNGRTLSAGTSYAIPQGATFLMNTDANGNLYILFAGNNLNTESTLASSATTDLGTAFSNIVSITGTTTITSLGSSASAGNPFFITRFTGALTLTYNVTSLFFPGAANYTTSANDVFMWKYEASGNWRCVGYALASGAALVGGAPLNSPAFTGTPTAPTASTSTNTTQLATTAFVQANKIMTPFGVASIILAEKSGGSATAGGTYAGSTLVPFTAQGGATGDAAPAGTWQALTSGPTGNVILYQRTV